MSHTNQFIVGLALCALGNICTAEMARDLAPEVEKLVYNNNSYIRKKVSFKGLCPSPNMVDVWAVKVSVLSI